MSACPLANPCMAVSRAGWLQPHARAPVAFHLVMGSRMRASGWASADRDPAQEAFAEPGSAGHVGSNGRPRPINRSVFYAAAPRRTVFCANLETRRLGER